jgi:exodeoxyribonuclease VII small subunit
MAKRNAETPTHADPSAAAAVQAIPLPATYEAALQELENLVGRLDAGQLPLDELLQQYQRGTALLRFCQGKLEAVEQQIQVFEDGEGRPWAGGA